MDLNVDELGCDNYSRTISNPTPLCRGNINHDAVNTSKIESASQKRPAK